MLIFLFRNFYEDISLFKLIYVNILMRDFNLTETYIYIQLFFCFFFKHVKSQITIVEIMLHNSSINYYQ